jgi:GDPmannose 4,6-dehydratase
MNEKLINLDNKKIIIKINKNFFRPAEVDLLIGDSSKANKSLKWKSKITFKQLVIDMIDNEIKYYN